MLVGVQELLQACLSMCNIQHVLEVLMLNVIVLPSLWSEILTAVIEVTPGLFCLYP